MMKQRMEIGDSQLEQVAGGFQEKAGPAVGQMITCPYCGRTSADNFKMSFFDGDYVAEYVCQNPACMGDPSRNHGVFYADPEGVCRPER